MQLISAEASVKSCILLCNTLTFEIYYKNVHFSMYWEKNAKRSPNLSYLPAFINIRLPYLNKTLNILDSTDLLCAAELKLLISVISLFRLTELSFKKITPSNCAV